MTIKEAEIIARKNISKKARIITGFEYGNKYVFAIKQFKDDFGYNATVDKTTGNYSEEEFLFAREMVEHPKELANARKTLIEIDSDF